MSTSVLQEATIVMVMQYASTQMGVLRVHAMQDTVVMESVVKVNILVLIPFMIDVPSLFMLYVTYSAKQSILVICICRPLMLPRSNVHSQIWTLR